MSKDTKNPWGKPGNDDRHYGPRSGHSGGGRQEPPDLDEMLRRAQENFREVMPGNLGGGAAIGLFLLAVAALWLASGFYIVNPGEHAVVQRFGAWSRTQTTEGLGYRLPAPIEKISKVDVNAIRRMNIGFIERPSRSGGSQKQEIPEESLMLTSDRNIVDLYLVIQWNIKSAKDYLFEIEDQENTIKKVAESAIREVAGQTDMFPIITKGRETVADKTKAIIQQNLDEYHSGVNITQVLIEKAEVHPEVQGAFQDVQSAKQDAEDTQNRANQHRNDILPKARGLAIQTVQEAEAYKEAQVAKSRGDADRFNAVYEAYLNGKDVTKERIFIETMEKVLGNAQKIIVDGENSQGVVPYLPLDQLKPAAGNNQGNGTATGQQQEIRP